MIKAIQLTRSINRLDKVNNPKMLKSGMMPKVCMTEDTLN